MRSKVIAITLLAPLTVFLAASVFASGVLPKHTSFSLPNGLDIILIEDNRLPLIDYRMIFSIGSSADSTRTSGLAAIAIEMLKEGTENFPGHALISAVDSTGGNIYMDIERDCLMIHGNFLSRDVEFALGILAEMTIRPQSEKEDLDRNKRRFISGQMQGESVAKFRLTNALYRSVYGDAGYGLPAWGTHSGIRRIKLEIMREFQQKNFRPNNAVLIMAGDFRAGEVKKLIKKLFSNWQEGGNFSESIVNASIPDSLKIIIIDNPDAPSTEFIIGRPAVPAGSEYSASLVLLNYILGGSYEISRLSQNLVQGYGLATSISSQIDWSREDGMISIRGASTNEMAPEAIKQVLGVMKDLRSIKVPARELEEAKNHFRGRIPGNFETISGTVKYLARFICLRAGLDYYEKMFKEFEKIDPDRLRNVAQEFLDEKHMIIVVIGPESILRRGLSDLGPVETERSGQD